MLRKIFAISILIMLSACGSAFSAQNAVKYSGPLLTGCHIYQLGADEFVLKLNGRNLPVPRTEIDDSSLEILIEGAQANNPDEINSSMRNLLETVPVLYGFSVENISEDNIQRVYVQVDANAPLSLTSVTRSVSGSTLRLKTSEKKDIFADAPNFQDLPKRTATFPENTLPFRAATRTTIEFRDADLQDVFRLFMAALGRNILIDASFPRNVQVTMTLVDVRIDEVMNYLLRAYDIACFQYAPNMIAFGTSEGLYKLSGSKELKTFKISYASPQRVGEILKNLLGFSVTLIEDTVKSGSEASASSRTTTGSSESARTELNTARTTAGSSVSEIMIDQRRRIIYVKTNPARMEEAEELIKMLDVPLRQVMIRASIFEFNDAATLDVQNSLNMVYDKWTFQSNPSSNGGILEFADRTYMQGRSQLDRYITNALSALETKNKGKTVANPSVITIEGEEAKIKLKQNIVYSAGRDDSGNPTWETEEVGPELTFTPIIEDKGYINLTIKINTGDYLGKDTDGNLRTTDREVETHIRVRDGMPFVVGGLFQDIETRYKSKIPILGDIPLFGNLFSYTSDENNKNQAVMIVTPYIIESM